MRLATVTGPAGTTAAVQDGTDWLALPAPDLSAAYRHRVLEPGAPLPAGFVPAYPTGESLPGAVPVLPLPNPRKVVCCGLNYGEHIQETVRDLPTHPRCSPSSPTPSPGRPTSCGSTPRRSGTGRPSCRRRRGDPAPGRPGDRPGRHRRLHRRQRPLGPRLAAPHRSGSRARPGTPPPRSAPSWSPPTRSTRSPGSPSPAASTARRCSATARDPGLRRRPTCWPTSPPSPPSARATWCSPAPPRRRHGPRPAALAGRRRGARDRGRGHRHAPQHRPSRP